MKRRGRNKEMEVLRGSVSFWQTLGEIIAARILLPSEESYNYAP
jgi:hypothetical protein